MNTLSYDDTNLNNYIRLRTNILATVVKQLVDLNDSFDYLGMQTPLGSLDASVAVFETYATRLLESIAQERSIAQTLHWETTAGTALNYCIGGFCQAGESHVGTLRRHIQVYVRSFTLLPPL